jgi:hypothetical protein
MHVLAIILGVFVLLATLWEAFETIVLPRTVTRSFRVARLLYRLSWRAWTWVARSIRSESKREAILGYFGPISLPLLLGFWAMSLIFAFGLIEWGLRVVMMTGTEPGFATYLYLSGITFFTVGYGDVSPAPGPGRFVSVLEGGVGLGFLAVIIGYLPVLYQAFSRREVSISLLDARAGSPPSAAEFLRRYKDSDDLASIPGWLKDWEQWSAELLESHLSYPVLAFYRSQHDRESWLSALTMVLDTCALIMIGVEGVPSGQAKLTFAIARHAIVDISLIFNANPIDEGVDRLDQKTFDHMCRSLDKAGIPICQDETAIHDLREIRGMYEPFVLALSRRFLLPLPPWMPDKDSVDNWQTSAWQTIDRHHFTT